MTDIVEKIKGNWNISITSEVQPLPDDTLSICVMCGEKAVIKFVILYTELILYKKPTYLCEKCIDGWIVYTFPYVISEGVYMKLASRMGKKIQI